MGNAACCKQKPVEKERNVASNDVDFNSSFKYADNGIVTSHYTWYNFLLLNLFEQFHRVVNIYFVFLLVLTFIPQVSSLNPWTTLLPIIFVLSITAIKDAVDDVNRHNSDRSINNRSIYIVKDGSLVKAVWENVRVGDIVKIQNNEHVAADVIVLSNSDENAQAYIETAELDGETNLKVRQALPVTAKLNDDITALSQFHGKVECEAPNNRLDRFVGNLTIDQADKFSLDNDKLILRGCTLRNTTWCYGLVIFAGHDTKLMQNSGRRVMKRTSIEKFMNKLVWWIFAALFILASIAAICNSAWESTTGEMFQAYLPWESYAPNPQMSGFLMFWSYLIVLNTLVPISLYVSVEFIRLLQSFLINWDRLLYYEPKDLPAVVRTTTLNEELGQVEYIFSDKTGTLTQNVMSFKKCSIMGKCYGELEPAVSSIGNGSARNGSALPHDVDFSPGNAYAQKGFHFYDQHLLLDEINQGNSKSARLFFRLLALCHTSLIENTGNDDELVYRSQSPDEDALVTAARNFGFVFKSRKYDTITVVETGEEMTYKILAVLEFNSVRKRMSVLVRTPQGKVLLLCKGADSVIYDRLSSTGEDPRLKSETSVHLQKFAESGLRTLCLAWKEIEEETFATWNKTFVEASQAIEDREDRLHAVYEEIERDLHLLGVTAIEDKLQDGVPETIANLARANIKIWVLTGDKQETAINIGYSCNMLTESMNNVFVISGNTQEEVDEEISDALKAIGDVAVSLSHDGGDEEVGAVNHAFALSAGDLSNSTPKRKISPTSSVTSQTFGLVINGHSLFFALEKQSELRFLSLATQCRAVICCRVTPLQKAKVVELVKRNKRAVTLAIGDGANDVSMIKAAHIGVGISGEEGTQAVLSADFAFGQFRYLERLLLVHGKWSYTRMCKFLGYFFYKNFAFTLIHFWYSIFNGFSAQSVFDDWFVTLYNTIYTATPVLVLACIDQDVSDRQCIRLPQLYLPGQRNELFNTKILLRSLLRGVVTSAATFFLCYGTFSSWAAFDGKDATDHQTFATTVATSVLFVVTLQIGLDTSYWTMANVVFMVASLIGYFPVTFCLNTDGLYNLFPTQFHFVGSARNVFSYPAVWFTVLLVVVVCLLPVFAIRYVNSMYFPSQSEKVLRDFSRATRKGKPPTPSTSLVGNQRPPQQVRYTNSSM